jgi:pyruvate dehydrogenase E1 component alpha subunit
VLCQFGDGAVETGSFHEALNLAGIWDPSRSCFRSSTISTAWAPRSSSPPPSPTCGAAPPAYRMHGERIDGNDVLAVREATPV